MKKTKELPKWTKRNTYPIQLVKVTKSNGKPMTKEVLYFWTEKSVTTFRSAVRFFEGFFAGWETFGGGKNCPSYLEHSCRMQDDGYEYHTHHYYDWYGGNGECGSGTAWRLERKDGSLVSGKDAWPTLHKKTK